MSAVVFAQLRGWTGQCLLINPHAVTAISSNGQGGCFVFVSGAPDGFEVEGMPHQVWDKLYAAMPIAEQLAAF